MPAVTQFVDGTGPVFAGKLFPFAFITIACGAISGFHALIASGTTPKMLMRETDARLVGYGAMLTESFVGVMAMIAAATLEPGVYFAMNVGPGALGTTAAVGRAQDRRVGLHGHARAAAALARADGRSDAAVAHRRRAEPRGRHGRHPRQRVQRQRALALWYHFAIMFEALFILTTIDAGTRVGRFMLQELLGHVWKPLGRHVVVSEHPALVSASSSPAGATSCTRA